MLAEGVQTESEFLTVKEVATLLGVSRNSLYVWQRRGGFPRPLKVGVKAIRFRRSEIMAWMDCRPRAKPEVGPATGE